MVFRGHFLRMKGRQAGGHAWDAGRLLGLCGVGPEAAVKRRPCIQGIHMKDDATCRLTAILIAALAVLSALAPVRSNISEAAPGESDVASRPPEGKLARPTPQQYA